MLQYCTDKCFREANPYILPNYWSGLWFNMSFYSWGSLLNLFIPSNDDRFVYYKFKNFSFSRVFTFISFMFYVSFRLFLHTINYSIDYENAPITLNKVSHLKFVLINIRHLRLGKIYFGDFIKYFWLYSPSSISLIS